LVATLFTFSGTAGLTSTRSLIGTLSNLEIADNGYCIVDEWIVPIPSQLQINGASIVQESCALTRVAKQRGRMGERWARAMSESDTEFDFDRYRRLLAEADDEPKRLAFINLLVDERAKDKLAGEFLRGRLAKLGLKAKK
jgi:hypothetical protein